MANEIGRDETKISQLMTPPKELATERASFSTGWNEFVRLLPTGIITKTYCHFLVRKYEHIGIRENQNLLSLSGQKV